MPIRLRAPALRHAEGTEAEFSRAVLGEELISKREGELQALANCSRRSGLRIVPDWLIDQDDVVDRDPIVKVAVGVKVKHLVDSDRRLLFPDVCESAAVAHDWQ